MFAVVIWLGILGTRITIAVFRVALCAARVALKAIIAVVLLSMIFVFSMPRLVGV